MEKGILNDARKAPPELQQEYDILVSNALRIIHGKAREAIVNQLKNQEPIQAVAQSAVNVIERIEAGAASKGKRINEGVLINGAGEIIQNIIELGVASKATKPMKQEDVLKAAKMAAGLWIKNALDSGKLTKEQLVQGAQALKQSGQGQGKGQNAPGPGPEKGMMV